MMQDIQHEPDRSRADDSSMLLAEARSLRRRLAFWRRTAWLLLGLVVLVLIVAWQRTTVRRRECRQSLEHYVEMAKSASLDHEPAEVLESQWQRFPKDSAALPAKHYALFVQNWLKSPGPDGSLPLAACRGSHAAVFTRGRHVLFRDEDGMHVKWLSEEDAAPYVARIQQD